MKVVATKTGYYGVARIKKDEVFELRNEADFSPNWMERVSDREEPDIDPDTGTMRQPRKKNWQSS
jgi:hypothetical protein